MRWNLQKLPMQGLQGVCWPLEAPHPTFDQESLTKFPGHTSIKIGVYGWLTAWNLDRKEGNYFIILLLSVLGFE